MMRSAYKQVLLGGALLLLAGGGATAPAQEKDEATPVGVVKATVFLGEFK